MQQWNDIASLRQPSLSRSITQRLMDVDDVRQELLDVMGRAVLVETRHSTDDASVAIVNEDLKVVPVCEIAAVDIEHDEVLNNATDRPVCEAAMRGEVKSILLKDIIPYGQSLPPLDEGEVAIVGIGQADLENTGKNERIGWAYNDAFFSGGVGPGRTSQFPVILDGDGLINSARDLSKRAASHSGQFSVSRLFRYKGSTYFEVHWAGSSDEHDHEIWRFSENGDTRVCEFSSGKARGFEVKRVFH